MFLRSEINLVVCTMVFLIHISTVSIPESAFVNGRFSQTSSRNKSRGRREPAEARTENGLCQLGSLSAWTLPRCVALSV